MQFVRVRLETHLYDLWQSRPDREIVGLIEMQIATISVLRKERARRIAAPNRVIRGSGVSRPSRV